MSISQNIRSNRIIGKLKLMFEILGRLTSTSKIFFPYKENLSHPIFDELKHNPPIGYANKRYAKFLHLVMGGSKSDLHNDHLIEIIDHAFSVIAPYEKFPREPVEYCNRQEKIEKIYLSKKLKKIIFISNGQRELFKQYFSNKKILDKSIVVPMSWKDNICVGRKEANNSVNFLFIASDYHLKGVEVVLKAWDRFKRIDESSTTLTLVSHDIPTRVEKHIHKHVKLINTIPLCGDLKNSLYKVADVVLAFTLTDGITAIEATSYGKPIVIFRTQHSKDFIDSDNGFLIDTPINMYDVDKYGIVWKTKKEFYRAIKEHFRNGGFDKTVDDIVDILNRYSKDKGLLGKHTKNAVDKYYKDYTIENRNKKLLAIYDGLT